MPTEDYGDHALVALLRNEITFSKLFELFVCNFYRSHLSKDYKVGYQEKLFWFDEFYNPLVPNMNTDITLERNNPLSRIVMDTKYSINTLASSQYGGLKFKSENLYQIYSYLRTQEHRGPRFQNAKGMLLYPTINHHLKESMFVQGHEIKVVTLNLAEKWECIEQHLLELAEIS